MKATDHIDTRNSNRRVNNNTLARCKRNNMCFRIIHLVGNKGRDIRLETTGPSAHDEHGDDEAGEGTVRMLEHGRETGDDEDDVADHGDEDGPADGLVTTPVRIAT